MSARRKPPKTPAAPRLLSLCSGIGGIDLAFEMAGGVVAGQCEIDGYCQQVLARHWPDVQRHGDIRSVWGDTFSGRIDVIAAGFPCQPASVAGQRRGAADARWLWPEVLRVVQVYEPAWLLLENVSGLISMGLDGVLADLDAAGYEAWPLVFPASAVGAPHQRERVFIVANAAGRIRCWRPQRNNGLTLAGDTARCTAVADTSGGGWRPDEPHLQARQCDATGRSVVADDDGERPQRDIQLHCAAQAGQQVHARCETRGCHADDGRPCQAESGVVREPDGLPRRLDGAPRHAWPAAPGQPQHPWEPPRVTQERIPHRAARLKALGNAVCPQQVYPILAAIIEQWRREQEVSA